MSEPEIPLARPLLGEAEEQAAVQVLRSGRLSLGPKLGEFEREFATRIGSPSGTQTPVPGTSAKKRFPARSPIRALVPSTSTSQPGATGGSYIVAPNVSPIVRTSAVSS